MIYSFRFGWLEFFRKENPFIRTLQYYCGLLFLHSRQIAYYLFTSTYFEQTDRVLDIGCGDGNFSNWIAYRTGAYCLGTDRLQERVLAACEVSERYHLSSEFKVETAESLSLPRANFDKILLIDVLEHLENPSFLLRRCRDWLTPNGTIFISVPKRIEKRWFGDMPEHFAYGNDKHISRGFEIEDLKRLINAGGLGIISRQEIFFSIYQVIWELMERIRVRHPDLYRVCVPLLTPFLFFDRQFPIGSSNGLLVTAKKI